MAASKLGHDVLWYWYYMRKFHDAASLVAKRYTLDVEMRKFVTEATHPPVVKLMEEFIEKQTKALG